MPPHCFAAPFTASCRTVLEKTKSKQCVCRTVLPHKNERTIYSTSPISAFPSPRKVLCAPFHRAELPPPPMWRVKVIPAQRRVARAPREEFARTRRNAGAVNAFPRTVLLHRLLHLAALFCNIPKAKKNIAHIRTFFAAPFGRTASTVAAAFAASCRTVLPHKKRATYRIPPGGWRGRHVREFACARRNAYVCVTARSVEDGVPAQQTGMFYYFYRLPQIRLAGREFSIPRTAREREFALALLWLPGA
eukprot:gene12351-biopygen18474